MFILPNVLNKQKKRIMESAFVWFIRQYQYREYADWSPKNYVD